MTDSSSRLRLLSTLQLPLLWRIAMTAEAADPLQYREALIAGDPARLSAMIEADKRQLPIDDAVITVLRRALHVYRWVSVHGSAGTRW